jgi:hypothetical protein
VDARAREILGPGSSRLVGPCRPWGGCFSRCSGGLLSAHAGAFAGWLAAHLEQAGCLTPPPSGEARALPGGWGGISPRGPPNYALVTSSIAYEAHLVLLARSSGCCALKFPAWPVPQGLRDTLLEAFADPWCFMMPSSRPPTQRDRLNPTATSTNPSPCTSWAFTTPEDFDRVAGFEDSESGTIAIRAAGIGLSWRAALRDDRGATVFKPPPRCAPGGLATSDAGKRLFLNGEGTGP